MGTCGRTTASILARYLPSKSFIFVAAPIIWLLVIMKGFLESRISRVPRPRQAMVGRGKRGAWWWVRFGIREVSLLQGDF